MNVFQEIKTTPNQIESWFRYHCLLEEYVLSDKIKPCDILESQSTANQPFRFLWDTLYKTVHFDIMISMR